MKLFCTIISFCFFLSLSAQDCASSLLFTKGAELEYKTYAPKGGLFGGGDFFEITRLSFTVQDVKDSNNIKYSYISKKGVNPNDPELAYEKKYVISCDGSRVSLPADFYNTDSVFFSNIYPKVKKDKGIYSSTLVKGKCIYHYPVNFETGKFEVGGKEFTMDVKVRDYEMATTLQSGNGGIRPGGQEFSGRITENTYSMDVAIKKWEVKGKEEINTPAGRFTCYKILLTAENEIFGRGVGAGYVLYYSTEAGFVKSETQQAKNKTGYAELVRIKK